MNQRCILLYFLICLSFSLMAQEEESTTPFKKDLWLTSLEGTISSSNSTLGNSNSQQFNTTYGFDISSNKLFKDRWAAGLRLTATRSASSSFIDRESESIFLGPSISHFFSDNPQGSLFLEFSPGYVRFFESSEANIGLGIVEEVVDGNGFGTIIRFGYAHVINEKVVFNFGMNITNFWILADRTSEPGPTTVSENLSIGSLAFSFGFSVLLEKFFF